MVEQFPSVEHCKSAWVRRRCESGKWYTPRLCTVEEVSLPYIFQSGYFVWCSSNGRSR